MSGWYGWQGSLARVAMAGAPDGFYVARVTGGGSGCCSALSSDNQTILTSGAGVRYTTTAWVRADNPASVGETVALGLRERHGCDDDSCKVGSLSSTVTLTGSWQEVTISLVSKNQGDRLDVSVLGSSRNTDVFDTDALTLVAG